MIGYLSPGAEFYKCNNYCHLDKAEEICNKLQIKFNTGIEAEEKLLKKGWVVFMARSAYSLYGYLRDSNNGIYSLTDEVIKYLKSHKGNYGNSDQEKAVEELLEITTFYGQGFDRILNK